MSKRVAKYTRLSKPAAAAADERMEARLFIWHVCDWVFELAYFRMHAYACVHLPVMHHTSEQGVRELAGAPALASFTLCSVQQLPEGGLVSPFASNRSSKSCSKGTTASRWLLSPLPLFQRGTVVPCCGKMSKEASKLGKTIINIWQSFLNLQGNCLVELKQREVSKRGGKNEWEKRLSSRFHLERVWIISV